MEEIVRTILLAVGRAFVPVSLVLALTTPAHIPPSPTPTPPPSVTATPSHSPTPTETPSPTQTPIPTPSHSLTPTNSPTPTLTPSPTSVPATGKQLDEWFSKYSSHYSIDRQKLWNVAVCESNLNPNAVNGPYGGLFQFSSSTWITTRTAMSMDANPDLRFNPEEAIRTAAFKMSTAGLSPWPNCGK